MTGHHIGRSLIAAQRCSSSIDDRSRRSISVVGVLGHRCQERTGHELIAICGLETAPLAGTLTIKLPSVQNSGENHRRGRFSKLA